MTTGRGRLWDGGSAQDSRFEEHCLAFLFFFCFELMIPYLPFRKTSGEVTKIYLRCVWETHTSRLVNWLHGMFTTTPSMQWGCTGVAFCHMVYGTYT